MQRIQQSPSAIAIVGKVRLDGGKIGGRSLLPESFLNALQKAWTFHVLPRTSLNSYEAMRDFRRLELQVARSREMPSLVQVDGIFNDIKDPSWHRVAEQLADAATSWGVARVVGHGVDFAKLHELGSRYFSLPEALRGGSIRNISAGFQRGSIPFAGESGSQHFLEVKEGFLYGYEWPAGSDGPVPSNPLEGHNVWPPDSDLLGNEFRATLQQYYDDSVKLSKNILEAVDYILRRDGSKGEKDRGASDPVNSSMHDLCSGGENISQMRLFNYLPDTQYSEVSAGIPRIGSSPHTDWYLLTVILRDSLSRLQIANDSSPGAETSWLDLPSGNGSELIVLFGDYLSLYTGGHTKSPVHRVLLPHDGSSLSFVFLFSPRYDARLPRPKDSQLQLAANGEGKINTLLDQADPMIWDRPFGEYAQRKRSRVMSNQR